MFLYQKIAHTFISIKPAQMIVIPQEAQFKSCKPYAAYKNFLYNTTY